MKKNLALALSVSIAATLLVAFGGFYVVLPAIHLQSEGFYVYLAAILAAFILPFFFLYKKEYVLISGESKKRTQVKGSVLPKWAIAIIAVPLGVLLLGGFISSEVFNAKAYAEIITVREADFGEDMPETKNVTNIALMDSDTASVVGSRTLGSLANVVSQYGIAGRYSQINYHNTPKKVADLEYLDFFKWLNNRSEGIPGYVMVDPVKNSAEYVELASPMRYSASGYFGDNLYRKLRFDYPTKIFDSIYFEIDENGQPFYVVSCTRPQVALFGAHDVEEVIIFNPIDGTSEIYAVEKTPSWIDCVYTGDLACQKYDWYGCLSGGFFNSIIGNVGCKETTSDYGYIVIADDVWYFTGVTSVTSDASNIGFILSNARTGEYVFYPVVGADEYSAMGAAQGEVQEKAYVASFPSLVNIKGQATYIMVLKDANSIVKLYALVNVENYSIVATGTTQDAAMEEYQKLLLQNSILTEEDVKEPEKLYDSTTFTVTAIQILTIDGNSVLYLKDESGVFYKGSFSEDESLILIAEGDRITLRYDLTDREEIRKIVSWERAAEENR